MPIEFTSKESAKGVVSKKDATQLARLERSGNSLALYWRKQKDGLWKGRIPLNSEDEWLIKQCIREGRRRERLGIQSS